MYPNRFPKPQARKNDIFEPSVNILQGQTNNIYRLFSDSILKLIQAHCTWSVPLHPREFDASPLKDKKNNNKKNMMLLCITDNGGLTFNPLLQTHSSPQSF